MANERRQATSAVLIATGFLLVIVGIALLGRLGWISYVLMGAGVLLLLVNVLRLLGGTQPQ